MKSLTALKTLALVCLIFTSCQTDNVEIPIDNEINSEKKVPELTDKSSYDALLFEGRMQWTAFIAAKVLLHNKNARTEVTNMISNKTIALEDLINTDDVTETAFEQDFMYELTEYYRYVRNPEEDRPPHGISGCCTNGTAEEHAAAFVNYMVNMNCVELYFPNYIIYAGNNPTEISSTAHPLTEFDSNYGYIRYAELQSDSPTDEVIVNQNYVDTHHIMIIARPVRDTERCEYRDIPVDDFTEFLND